MKIVYLIAGTYRPAGMERVLANKANWLVSHGYDVSVVTTDQMGREPVFKFDERIRLYDLGVNYEENNGGSFLDKLLHYPAKQRRHKLSLSRLLGEIKPDVTVSMFCNDASFVPKLKDGSKKVLEVHFSRFKRLQYGRRGVWALADRIRSWMDLRTVRRFDRFVVLTHEDLPYWGSLDNICVIPNARSFKLAVPSSTHNKVVLASGRYSFQKNLVALLDIWARIPQDVRSGWTLRIAGDGEDRTAMESRIIDLGLGGSVVLGRSDDMEGEYRNAAVFVLTSRFEGLPMVLLEAQAAGLPVVSYECKCGPKDVLTDGVDGFLVTEGDEALFAEKLGLLMHDELLRAEMGTAAYKASDRFEEQTIMEKWTELFAGL